MTDESAPKSAKKPRGNGFKKGYDPRRWLGGRGKKSPEQKEGEQILLAVIWEELSREFDTVNMKPLDNPETVDAMRLMVRSWIKKKPELIAERIAGKVVERKDKNEADEEARKMVLTPDLMTSDFLAVYRDIMEERHIEYTFDGGRGGLKSTFISEIITVLLCNNPDMHALILRQVKNDLRDSVYAQIIWTINILGISHLFDPKVSPMEITYLPTGQKIYFRGADNPESLKSIKPPFGYIGLLWFEEFDQFRGEAAIRNIVQSALRGGDRAFRFESWNTPRSKNHWVNKYMKLPKENRYHTTANYLNVPREWLGEIFIEEAEILRELNPKAYEHEYGGIANGEGGMVFDNVELRTITDEEIEQFDNIRYGLDWGFSSDGPFAFVKTQYDSGSLTLYIFDELRAVRKRNEETAELLQKEKSVGPNDVIIADSAEPKSIKDYRAFGLNCRGAEKGKNSVSYSMRWLQGRVKIIIDPKRCPYTTEEFTAYESTIDKNGDVIDEYPDKNNHFIDAARYATNLIWRVGGQ